MTNYLIDFETRSDLDISVGIERYLRTSNSDIISMSYWDKSLSSAKIWLPGNQFPIPEIGPDDRVYAFNIQFDQRVWNFFRDRYNLPFLPLENCVDVMALCGRYGYPQKLAKVGKILKLRVQKMPITRILMTKVCSPPFKYTKTEFNTFLQYCLDDTNTMKELLEALPADVLSRYDNELWQMTVKMNRIGLPVDTEFVALVNVQLREEKKKAQELLVKLTNGAVTTLHQRDRILRFTEEHGVTLPNLQAGTVDLALGTDLPPVVEKVLELRKVYGKAALSKYERVLGQIYKGRVYDNLRFYGGHTGRWSGLGFQVHNLYRGDKGIDQEALIADIKTRRCDNVTRAARQCVRGIIRAPKGKLLAVLDYKSVENVLMAHTAGEESALERHRSGKDEYKDFASKFFKVPYDQVSEEQRIFSKPPVLGAQYGLAGKGLIGYAGSYGVDMSPPEADAAIQLYRQDHPKTVRFWYQLHWAMKQAIMHPGTVFGYRAVKVRVAKDRNGKKWMIVTLPSGRNLYYADPEFRENIFGNIGPTYKGWKDHQWQRIHISPGHATENVIQALGVDVIAKGKMNLFKAGYQVDVSIHDEVIIELDEDKGTPIVMDHISSLMCEQESWAGGLPLSVEGEFLFRYKKI